MPNFTDEHTPEPWDYSPFAVYNASDILVADCVTSLNRDLPIAEKTTNARRIAACVNACAGLPTSILESLGLGGILPRLILPVNQAACEVCGYPHAMCRCTPD